MASETLSLGSPPIRVNNQGFGLVFHASTDFLGVSCDGLFVRPRPAPMLGCRVPMLVTNKQCSVMACLAPQSASSEQLHAREQLASAGHHAGELRRRLGL